MKKLYSLIRFEWVELTQQFLRMSLLVRRKDLAYSAGDVNASRTPFSSKVAVVMLLTGVFSLAVSRLEAQTLTVNATSYCPGSQVTVTVSSNKNGKTTFNVGVYSGNTTSATLLQSLGIIETTSANTEVSATYTLAAASNGTPRFIGSIPGQGQNVDLFSSQFSVGLPESPIVSVINNQPTTIMYGGVNPTFSVTPPSGLQVRWYNAATNGTLLTSSSTYTPTDKAVGTYTYYAELYNSTGCASVTRTPVTLAINRKELTISGVSAVSRVYTGATAAALTGTATLNGVVPGESITLSTTGVAAAFDSKTVGNGKAVTVTGYSISGATVANYTLVQPTGLVANITPKALIVAGAIANSKTYDGTTSATIGGTLTGVISPDVVTWVNAGTFASSNVGTGIAVTSAGSLSGTDSGNYTLTQPAGLTANINRRSLTVTAVGQNKTYDGTTDASVVLSSDKLSADAVTLAYSSAVFADKNVGVKPINVSGISISGTAVGNYVLAATTATASASISQRALVVSAVGQDKTYDGLTVATVLLSANQLANDVVNPTYTSAAFGTKNVAANKTVSVSGISISGLDAANYSFNTSATAFANITQRTLNVTATCQDRIYDGGISAPVTLTSNKVSGDVVNAIYGSATFADKKVGANKVVTVEDVRLDGADALNYILSNTIASPSAAIIAKPVAATFTVKDKVFDNNTSAEILTKELVGLILGDKVDLAGGTAKFDSPEVGSGKEVTLSNAFLTGDDAGNYALEPIAPTTASIFEPSPLPVTLLSFEGKQINGSVNLAWKTAAEKDNDYFQVERSKDGKSFVSIGRVKGNGNSNVLQSYAFTDASAQAGTVYYRLKQVDFDGKSEYSKVISVKADGKAVAQASVSVYPNPTTGTVYFASSDVTGAATVILLHSQGGVVSKKQVSLEAGHPIALDLTNQAAGVYYLQVQTATGKTTTRVVKQ
ncbi:YDG domain-containing protein [Rufibacter sediminis]|uniref:T9SS type A sorting domain-containing protein n=1 Tax=Rufibacter sediminis TaxID=2762756 RepID=A0ABR6VUT4_9BACT|nr:YDG domain-containing protein [Rufibacter sediminis]MBC3540965.1 T9SS type A sorting domain-containing protein [Rufibacter sediminis]